MTSLDKPHPPPPPPTSLTNLLSGCIKGIFRQADMIVENGAFEVAR